MLRRSIEEVRRRVGKETVKRLLWLGIGRFGTAFAWSWGTPLATVAW